MKALIFGLFFVLGLGLLATPVSAAPDCQNLNSLTPAEQAICGVNPTNPGGVDENPDEKINQTLAAVMGIFRWIIGIAASLVVLISAFRLIVGGGSSETRSSVFKAILYTLVGVIIAFSAEAIILFVLERV